MLGRSIIIILENRSEDDRLTELLDSVTYQAKLMSCYSLDTRNGNWGLTKFPVTQTDKQAEGIVSNVQKYNETIHQYNEYATQLEKDYSIDINCEMKKGL